MTENARNAFNQMRVEQQRDFINEQNEEIRGLEARISQLEGKLEQEEILNRKLREKQFAYTQWMEKEHQNIVDGMAKELIAVQRSCEDLLESTRVLTRIWNKPERMYWFHKSMEEFESSYGETKAEKE